MRRFNINTQNEFLEKLKEWGFKTNPLINNKTIDNLIKNYNEIEKRSEIDFDIDESFIKLMNLNYKRLAMLQRT